jgi:hypothetical protein
MALASNEDVRAWIPEDKLQFDDPDIAGQQLQASRLIISSLSGVFTPSLMAGWATPEDTPGIIRNVASELVAAYYYRDRSSEEGSSDYAQTLYDEAIGKIAEIRAGTLIVLDENDNPITDSGLDMNELDFFPNDSAAPPVFTMTMDGIFG